MPEIAEVEHARLRIDRQVLNYKIIKVETQPDTIVYKDVDPKVFGETILNRKLVTTKRWGKYFMLIFDQGPHIVAHLGMTGGIRFKHEEKPEDFPPRFWKLLITFQDPQDENKVIDFGFKDPRRLARLRLVSGDNLMLEAPLNKLGFDPIHNLPSQEEFDRLVLRRAMPIKALLLDQSFSAGVGNWVADEVLYQAMVHPGQYTNTLTEKELSALYNKLKYVCETAIRVEADHEKFPSDWLMKYRWGKGKKNKQLLPNGMSLKFETHGGRTSAFAPSIQKLRASNVIKKAIKREPKTEVKKEVQKEIKTIKKETKTIKKRKSSGLKKQAQVKVKVEEKIPGIVKERKSSRYSFRQI